MNNTTEVLQHKIAWTLDDSTITNLDDSDTEHIADMIIHGYSEGAINHGENNEVRGHWEIKKPVLSGVIEISIVGGCLDEVKGLPEGWTYKLTDYDNE